MKQSYVYARWNIYVPENLEPILECRLSQQHDSFNFD